MPPFLKEQYKRQRALEKAAHDPVLDTKDWADFPILKLKKKVHLGWHNEAVKR